MREDHREKEAIANLCSEEMMQKAVRANNGKEARNGMIAATNQGREDQV